MIKFCIKKFHSACDQFVSDSAAPLTVAYQLLCLWNYPGKNNGVRCHSYSRDLPTQGLNPWLNGFNPLRLLHWQAGSLTTSATWEALKSSKLSIQNIPLLSYTTTSK